jgi:uncharacterized LabA/DUF88 family protein
MQEYRNTSIVYIDGYNWYHAIFKHHPAWKWLNIQTFFEALRPREDVIAVKLFSALVLPEPLNGDARERQERYFKALKTLPKVKVILGIFQQREVQCRATCRLRYTVPEEKKTDVNIAVEMLSDATAARCDAMVLVSGDSDAQPVVEWIAKNKPDIDLTVYVPALLPDQSSRRTDYYRTKGLNVTCKFLPLEDIKNHQLPNTVKLPDGNFAVRPHIWQVSPCYDAATNAPASPTT